MQAHTLLALAATVPPSYRDAAAFENRIEWYRVEYAQGHPR